MKSSVPAVDGRAPLSQYLRAEDEDGWTVFSSDDDRAEVELASKPERSPDLSVLKRIKNFISDEAKQEDAFFSNDVDDGAQNFRVDYPFYDSNLDEDDSVEASATSKKESVREVGIESSIENEPQDEPSATRESVESAPIVPQDSPREEKNQNSKGKRAASSRLQFAPVVLQAPKKQTTDAPSETISQSSEAFETTTVEATEIVGEALTESTPKEPSAEDSKDAEDMENEGGGAVNSEKSDANPHENIPAETTAEPCVEDGAEERVERESNATKTPLQTEETSNPQTFLVDFSETLAPALERQARGEKFEEPPLVQTPARRSKRVKKESKKLATSENEEANKARRETSEEESRSFPFVRSRCAGNARMAIFRRCVDLVSQRAKPAETSAPCEAEFERSSSQAFEPDAPVPWDDAFDYGESVAFVAAPCFSDLGVVASFATTCNSSTL